MKKIIAVSLIMLLTGCVVAPYGPYTYYPTYTPYYAPIPYYAPPRYYYYR